MRPTGRHTIPAAAVAAIVAMAAWPAGGEPSAITGTVAFEAGAVIPPGEIELRLEDPGDGSGRRAAATRVESDGKSREIKFSFSGPVGPFASRAPLIVATLERPDGWLVARGSAPFVAGFPVRVTLHAVIY